MPHCLIGALVGNGTLQYWGAAGLLGADWIEALVNKRSFKGAAHCNG